MEKIGIITDSHSSITREEADKLGIKVLPMPFYINGECYYEDVNLTREKFFLCFDEGKNVSTSQPSPDSVMSIWREGLKEYEKILYLPISSGLSGSCMTAQGLALEEEFNGKVLVVDNGRVSTTEHCAILDALGLIKKGYSAEEIKCILENYKNKETIYLSVKTLDYLKKGGRISSATAVIGGALNITPVLKFDIGNLDSYKKCRGIIKAKRLMLTAIREDLENRFKEWYEKGKIYLLAASSGTEEETVEWVREIKEEFPDMEVMCDNLSLGVCCHTGPGALGIGCSCKPILDEYRK